MSSMEEKTKRSRRRYLNHIKVVKQVKIANNHGIQVDEPHRFHKHHALDCGIPECMICASPRRVSKGKNRLTMQERRAIIQGEEVDDTSGEAREAYSGDSEW